MRGGHVSARTGARSARRTAVSLIVLLVAGLVAGCTDDGDPAPADALAGRELDRGRRAGPADVRGLRVRGRGRGLRRHGPRVQLAQRRGPGQRRHLAQPRRGGRRARGRRGAPGRVPGLPARPRRLPARTRRCSRSTSCSTSAASTSATATRATRCRRSACDDRLQCMPYGISPMVIYYNTELIDFDRMRARGLDAGARTTGGAAARVDLRAVRRRRRVRHPAAPGHQGRLRRPDAARAGAVHLLRRRPDLRRRHRPDVAGVLRRRAPARAGADARAAPQRPVTLSAERARAALGARVVRARQARDDGRLPDLVPELRQVQGLDFDVMPMPVLERRRAPSATSPACACRRTPPHARQAADFMVHAHRGVGRRGRPRPATSCRPTSRSPCPTTSCSPAGCRRRRVFNTSVRDIVLPPLLTTGRELEDAVAGSLEQLFNQPILDNLDELTTQIDEEPHGARPRVAVDPEADERRRRLAPSASVGSASARVDCRRPARPAPRRRRGSPRPGSARPARSATGGRRTPRAASRTASASVAGRRGSPGGVHSIRRR